MRLDFGFLLFDVDKNGRKENQKLKSYVLLFPIQSLHLLVLG